MIIRFLKGLWCSFLMFASSYVYSYEHDNDSIKRYMYKTEEGKKEYKKRMRKLKKIKIDPEIINKKATA